MEIKEKKDTEKTVVITVDCIECKKRYDIPVNKADYFDWYQGLLIQKAFPYLTDGIRELLISNICPKCWEKMFGSEEEE